MSSMSGTVSSSYTGETKTGNSTTSSSVYSATSYVPAVLANPLSVRATVLRKPEFFELSLPELVEEGDILFDVLANPLYYPSKLVMNEGVSPLVKRRSEAISLNEHGISSILSLPTAIGRHFVGQPFRAFLSFHNAATYPLAAVAFRIESLHPIQQRTTLVSYECQRLEGKGNASFKVEFTPLEPGQHTLSVNVKYLDIVNESKRLTWASSFQVERAITEVYRSLNIIPIITSHKGNNSSLLRASGPTLKEVISNITLPIKKYALSICLQNTSSSPLAIVSVELHAGEAFEVLPPPRRSSTINNYNSLPLWWPASSDVRNENVNAFRMHYTGGGKDALEDLHLSPRDKRNYFFEFIIKPDSLRNLALCHGPPGVPVSLAATSIMDVGYVEWKWRRVNGDSGTERSSLVRLGRLSRQPTLEMLVVSVKPDVPKAGVPMILDCIAINYDSENHIDLALRVRPELLEPTFVYAGPLVSPLGLIEPRGTLHFQISLVPWCPGWAVVRGGLELCEARPPGSLLWPLRPITTPPPPLSTSLSGASSASASQARTAGGGVVEALEPTAYPPILCELLIC